jgi:chemotaxis protein methyltransferase CheR
LVFAPNRCESLELAVRTVMRAHALRDLGEFQRNLSSGALSWDELIAQMTVGETYFFRDKEHFEFLTARVLPELFQLRGDGYRPRVWSAGCASGEEAYSLAMALAESGHLEGAFVLGTDLNRTALARARAARYTKWSLRGLDPRLLEKYFQRSGAGVQLIAELRPRVTFQELNLAGVGYPSPATSTFSMDLILCRNVLIYLGAETIERVSRRLFDSLSPGGYLITGPSDPLLTAAGFEILTVPAGIAYRRPFAGVAAVSRAPEPAQLAAQPKPRPRPSERAANEPTLEARTLPDDAQQALARVRARSNSASVQVAEPECRAALLRYPLCAELHYLHAALLLDLNQKKAARDALRHAIYLEPSLAIAHFTLGSVLAGLKDGVGAERAYRNAEQYARTRPADEPVPGALEISAQGLASAAARELALLRGQGVSR